MSLEVWIAFALASAVLLAVPGPTVMLVASYALGRGRSSGWATVPGVALGDLTAMTASLLGAGAVLAASATAFTVLKLAGAGYLIWLGVKLWRAPARLDPADLADDPAGRGQGGRRAMFANAYLVTALNPKSIVFFIAFAPQFIDPGVPTAPQFAAMIGTFVTLAAINAGIWAALAGELRRRTARPSTLRLANRIGGGCMIAAGLLTAAVRRTA